ncbi:hypothetical protein Zmor_015407 [Zophobas morio]|uniref:Uncharacterized protein n=1 Tax=Zophobas morio TaxID=2755281 RepID=A0AA38IE42_9CUCU|nr:hypothetical protein Zmor_015407 [Zophobas morio]
MQTVSAWSTFRYRSNRSSTGRGWPGTRGGGADGSRTPDGVEAAASLPLLQTPQLHFHLSTSLGIDEGLNLHPQNFARFRADDRRRVRIGW